MCGDGANDCGALKAAHTGISLSDAESSVASPFTSKNPNITCVPDIIKEGRAALVTSFGIFKYMAAYSLCQFISVMVLYSIDSNLTDIQFLYIDLFIIAVFAFFFGKTHSYSGNLLVQVLLVIAFQVWSFEFLKQQSWFVPFNSEDKEDKDSVSCVENYTIFTVSSFQYLILAIVFSKGKPYRQSIFSNYGFIISAVILTAFSVYMALDPAEFFLEQFELILPEVMNFRLYLLAYALANFVLAMLLEVYLIEHIIFKKFRFKWHDIYKSRRKFLAVEQDLYSDTKWPMLSSDFRSAASPIKFTPSCTAEIVVEKQRSFEKNHILSGILGEGGAETEFKAIGEVFTPSGDEIKAIGEELNPNGDVTSNGEGIMADGVEPKVVEVVLKDVEGQQGSVLAPEASVESLGAEQSDLVHVESEFSVATPDDASPMADSSGSADFESLSTPDSVMSAGNFESFAEVHPGDDSGSVVRSRKSSALEMNELELR